MPRYPANVAGLIKKIPPIHTYIIIIIIIIVCKGVNFFVGKIGAHFGKIDIEFGKIGRPLARLRTNRNLFGNPSIVPNFLRFRSNRAKFFSDQSKNLQFCQIRSNFAKGVSYDKYIKTYCFYYIFLLFKMFLSNFAKVYFLPGKR